MKKPIACLLGVCLTLALCACSGTGASSGTRQPSPPTAPESLHSESLSTAESGEDTPAVLWEREDAALSVRLTMPECASAEVSLVLLREDLHAEDPAEILSGHRDAVIDLDQIRLSDAGTGLAALTLQGDETVFLAVTAGGNTTFYEVK